MRDKHYITDNGFVMPSCGCLLNRDHKKREAAWSLLELNANDIADMFG